MRTEHLPITISYFDPDGWYLRLGGRYVHQNIEEFTGANETVKDNEDFVLADAMIGYRLPRRYGILTLSLTNIFDKSFSYYNLVLPNGIESEQLFLPERQILLKMTVAF